VKRGWINARSLAHNTAETLHRNPALRACAKRK